MEEQAITTALPVVKYSLTEDQEKKEILRHYRALLRALRYHALIADALKLRNAPQARLLMQGHMNSMLDEVLASEARKEAKQNL